LQRTGEYGFCRSSRLIRCSRAGALPIPWRCGAGLEQAFSGFRESSIEVPVRYAKRRSVSAEERSKSVGQRQRRTVLPPEVAWPLLDSAARRARSLFFGVYGRRKELPVTASNSHGLERISTRDAAAMGVCRQHSDSAHSEPLPGKSTARRISCTPRRRHLGPVPSSMGRHTYGLTAYSPRRGPTRRWRLVELGPISERWPPSFAQCPRKFTTFQPPTVEGEERSKLSGAPRGGGTQRQRPRDARQRLGTRTWSTKLLADGCDYCCSYRTSGLRDIASSYP